MKQVHSNKNLNFFHMKLYGFQLAKFEMRHPRIKINTGTIGMCLIFIIFLVSCVAEKALTPAVELNKTNVSQNSEQDVLKLIKQCQIVRLQTNTNSLIGKIADIQFDNNKIFILNDVKGEKEILVFDKNGLFLNKIGEKGNGPEQYLAMNSFCLDTNHHIVVLMDQMKNETQLYDYSGKRIKKMPWKNPGGYIFKMRYSENGKIIAVNMINPRTNISVFESDEDLGNMKVFSFSNFKNKTGDYCYASNPLSDKNYYYLKPMTNMVYRYDGDHQTSAFELNFKNETRYFEKFTDEKSDYGDIFMESLRKGHFPASSILETNRYILFVQCVQHILWDKKQRKGYGTNCFGLKGNSNLLPFIPCSVIGVSGNNFVASITSDYVNMINDYYAKNKITLNREIDKFLKGYNPEENPLLVFYQFK